MIDSHNLFDDLETPIFSEWKDMPEFIQEQQEPFAKIIVRFNSKESMLEFANLINQKITEKTKSIWHPKLTRGVNSAKLYVNEP